MGYLAAGRVGLVPRGEWNNSYDYKKLDVVSHENKVYMARKSSLNVPPMGYTTEYWLLLIDAYLKDMHGATADANGAHGLVPQPLAGDEDKVLSGSGEWKYKLQTDILNNDGTIGYMNDGDFIPFFTYEDAIKEVLMGTAEPENVLIGTSFTNHTARGLSGTMKDFSHSQLVVTNGATDSNRPAMRKTTVGGTAYYEVSMPTGYWAYSLGSSSALIPAEEKTVTAATSTVNVEPSAGKVLTKVIINGINGTLTQEKTITASRSQQIVTPDSGKVLSKVTVNKYPDATGTYKPTANSSASDMGATNNYRYVDTTAVYKLGAVNRVSNAVKIGSAESVASKTFTVTSYSNYKNFSVKNFFYIVTKVTTDIGSGYAQTPPAWDKSGWYGMANVGTGKITMLPKLSYDASTGVLTVSGLKASKSISVSAKIDCSSHDHQEYGGGSFSVTETLFIDVYLIPT